MAERVIALSIETSTPRQSVALCAADGAVTSARDEGGDRAGHSRDLSRRVCDLLAAADTAVAEVSHIVIGVGPGSFTGLRVGLALAKGIALVTGARLIPVTTPRAVAAACGGDAVAWAINAHRGLAYATASREGGTEALALDAFDPRVLAQALVDRGPAWALVGDAFDLYRDELAPAIAAGARRPDLDVPCAVRNLAAARAGGWAGVDAASVEPIYVRRSAAEEARAAR